MAGDFWTAPVFSRIRYHLSAWRGASVASTRAHAEVLRLSGGRIRRSYLMTGGLDVLVLTTIGRRSGHRRSIPLAYLRHGSAVAVVASNGGRDRTPDWWLNLQAQPLAEILIAGDRLTVRAREADSDEDRVIWDAFIAVNRGFGEYRRLTARRIPAVVLDLV